MEGVRSRSVEACAGECLECHQHCLSALEYCISKGGDFAKPEHLRLLRVCAEICRTAAFVLESRSEFFDRTCVLCAEVCNSCAESCEALKDDFLDHCARSCRDCADSCVAITTSRAA
jgi:hypothetical protein